MVISPDGGRWTVRVYLANNLSADMGMFYKRRDYSTVINGRNPIVAHEFLGASVEDKTVLIIDIYDFFRREHVRHRQGFKGPESEESHHLLYVWSVYQRTGEI